MGKQSEKWIAIDDGQRWSHIHIIGVLEKEKQSNVKEMLFKVIIQKISQMVSSETYPVKLLDFNQKNKKKSLCLEAKRPNDLQGKKLKSEFVKARQLWSKHYFYFFGLKAIFIIL